MPPVAAPCGFRADRQARVRTGRRICNAVCTCDRVADQLFAKHHNCFGRRQFGGCHFQPGQGFARASNAALMTSGPSMIVTSDSDRRVSDTSFARIVLTCSRSVLRSRTSMLPSKSTAVAGTVNISVSPPVALLGVFATIWMVTSPFDAKAIALGVDGEVQTYLARFLMHQSGFYDPAMPDVQLANCLAGVCRARNPARCSGSAV